MNYHKQLALPPYIIVIIYKPQQVNIQVNIETRKCLHKKLTSVMTYIE